MSMFECTLMPFCVPMDLSPWLMFAQVIKSLPLTMSEARFCHSLDDTILVVMPLIWKVWLFFFSGVLSTVRVSMKFGACPAN